MKRVLKKVFFETPVVSLLLASIILSLFFYFSNRITYFVYENVEVEHLYTSDNRINAGFYCDKAIEDGRAIVNGSSVQLTVIEQKLVGERFFYTVLLALELGEEDIREVKVPINKSTLYRSIFDE